jgi:cytidine deaminase
VRLGGILKIKLIEDTLAQQLLASASAATSLSHVPYSNFPVGAAVLGKSGRIYQGINIENASYPAGICAERVALGCACSSGEDGIVAIAIFSPKGDISPCGICRQFILEFGESIVVVFHWNGKVVQCRARELLPYAFTKEHVK